jgi:hypothetical protein
MSVEWTMPEAQYHGRPELSASLADTLVSLSPAHTRIRMASTREMDRGTIVHALLLGHAHRLLAIDEDSYRSKNAKAKREAAVLSGRVPILASQLDYMQTVVAAIKIRLADKGVDFSDGDTEVSLFWDDDGTPCRSRLDYLNIKRGLVRDLKTCASAHPRSIARAAALHGYDIQEHVYRRAVEANFPELVGRVQSEYVFVETEPPYCVTVTDFGGTMRELGERRWLRAKAIWNRCQQTGEWPDYTTSKITLQAPPWALSEELEREFDEPEPAAEPARQEVNSDDDADLF